VPEVPEALSNLVMGMMAKQPEQRPTLAVMRQWFASIRGVAPPGAPAPAEIPVATGQRPAWVYIAIVAAVVVVAVMSFVVVKAVAH
jgi:Na+/melibiose symporter-like transporter